MLSEKRMLIVPVSDTVLLPGVTATIWLQKDATELLKQLKNTELLHIALPLKRNLQQQDVQEADFYRLGVTFKITQLRENDKGNFLEIKTLDRVEVKEFYQKDKLFYGLCSAYSEQTDLDDRSKQQMLSYLKEIVREISEKFQGGKQFVRVLDSLKDINSLIVYLSRFMPLSVEEKYDFLKTDSLRERSLHFMDALLKQKENVELNMQINERMSDKTNRLYRKQLLKEQLKAIQEELNEDEGGARHTKKNKDYRVRIKKAGMPEDIKAAALEEVDKLEAQGQESAETSVIRNYLDFMLQLPWKRSPQEDIDLNKARQILNAGHYGLKKVKERILQHLAVMQLKKNNHGSILLLVGPPGTGKTSIGKSIAHALNRKYIRLSLGGVRDEAEIRGHRKTYVGAMPGRILQSMKTAAATNPVMVLDEVDKLMPGGFSGDPASALLEVLDPEQNNTFTDHYLDLPYDLSDVFFIATANSLDTIPGPLLDRMEVIQISSYTEEEKFHIAKEHLVGEVLSDTGLEEGQLIFADAVLKKIITDYTLEGGVRGLKKQLATIARVISEKIVSKELELPYAVKSDELEDMLGHTVTRHDRVQKDNPPGVVTGLAWTPVGGEILFIEATDMPGSGEVTLTGQLGDVMKESARISLSLLKSRLPLSAVNFKKRDIHIHVPSGAVPKDGPSAGITIFTALASLYTGIKIEPDLAMTGEITLRGAVMPIGGLKEKLLAALRAGSKKILIPKDNVVDLKDLPEEVRSKLTIVPVETVEDVLKETLSISLPRIEHILNLSTLQQHTYLGA